MNLIALALVAATTLMGSHDTPKGDKKTAVTVRYGEPVKAGNGTLRSFVRLNAQGKVTQLGVAISEATVSSLPAEMAFWVLNLPKESAKTHVQHVSFDWMPHGHEPDGVYNVPHFDCHFYYTSNDERMSIIPDDPRAAKNPDQALLPQGYVKGPAVPQMGAHWLDPTSPELNGKPFTTTFIYGSLDGKVTFLEPMFTLAFLQQVKDDRLPVKQPAKVEKAGLYPAQYRFAYNAAEKQYEVILDDLQDRQ